MAKKDKSAEYVGIVQPLVDKLAEVCEKLDIPYVALVQLDDDRSLARLAGESMIMGSYHIVKDVENISTPIAEAIQHMLPDGDKELEFDKKPDPSQLN